MLHALFLHYIIKPCRLQVGKPLRDTATSGFRQCVYDPAPGRPDYWLSGSQPGCPRADCGPPPPIPGADYGDYADTTYQVINKK